MKETGLVEWELEARNEKGEMIIDTWSRKAAAADKEERERKIEQKKYAPQFYVRIRPD